MIGPLERNIIGSGLTLLFVLIAYAIFAPFHSELKGCEIAVVVEKQFTGRDNDIPTLYAHINKGAISKTTDEDTYFSVEVGDQINYCTYVDSLFPGMTNFTTLERIKR